MGQPVLILPHLERPKEIGRHHRLLCLSGPLKGKAFFFNAKRIVIGRGDESDIRIADSQMSRQHVEIVFVDDYYTLTDLKSHNGVMVNNKKVSQVKLSQGDTVIIGQSVFKYAVIEIEEKIILPTGQNHPVDIQDPFSSSESKKKETSKKSKNNLILIFALLILGAILMLDTGENIKKKNIEATKTMENANEFNDILKKKQMMEDRELGLKLDAVFQRGLRELREGNYFRAMGEFNHALSLSPNNGRASFYLDKAKQALDNEIEQHFIKGKKNYESLKLKEAIQSYCAIARLLQNNKEDDRFVDSMENIKEIEIKLGLAEGEIKCL